MNAKKILTHGLINKAALARLMYPNLKDAKVRLAHKMKGLNKQKITEQDEERVIEIIEELCACDATPELLCKNCGWEGDTAELAVNEYGHDACPACLFGSELQELRPN